MSIRRHYLSREVAEDRGVKVDTVLSWIHTGDLRAVDCSCRPGGRPRWRISDAALAEFDAKRSSVSKTNPRAGRIHQRRDPDITAMRQGLHPVCC